MIFKTRTREYRGETAAGLVHAMRRDGVAAVAARRPSSAFLEGWIDEFDERVSTEAAPFGRGAEAVALDLLYLCQEYRLGVLAPDDASPSTSVASRD